MAFGKGTWHRRVAHRRPGDERFSYPNSSRSDSLTFSPVICNDCNSRRSHRIDRDYDRFADFIRKQGPAVYESGVLDWGAIYGDAWAQGRDNVLRYWVKHIGCRLAELAMPIDPSFVAFLDETGPLQGIDFRLEIREDFAALQRHSVNVHGEELSMLGLGDLTGWADRQTGAFTGAQGHWSLDALRLNYGYRVGDAVAGANFYNKVNELPRDWNVHPDSVGTTCQDCRGCGAV
jgi:hypothetical protein